MKHTYYIIVRSDLSDLDDAMQAVFKTEKDALKDIDFYDADGGEEFVVRAIEVEVNP